LGIKTLAEYGGVNAANMISNAGRLTNMPVRNTSATDYVFGCIGYIRQSSPGAFIYMLKFLDKASPAKFSKKEKITSPPF
jgi:hypothetical protein